MFDFIGKKILITGASGGIGKELTKSFLENGADVFITGTNSQKLTLLNKELNGKCKTIECNLSSVDDTNNLIDYLNGFGGMDILINNAGKTEDNLFMRMTDKQWEDVMLINLTSVMRLTRGVIRGMIKKRWGRVINISSIVALTGNPGQSNYVTAKSGLIGFSKSLASEVASRGITVNCIAPGFIDTNMTEKVNNDEIEINKEQNVLNKGKKIFNSLDGKKVYTESIIFSGEEVHVESSGLFINLGQARAQTFFIPDKNYP